MPIFFDGEKRPRLTVTAAVGGALDPGPTYIHLGVGPGLGAGLVSGVGAGSNDVDITADVRSVSISQRGRDSDIDAGQPVTATIVLSNRHGNYDPSNPSGPYWGISGLTANQGSLEDGTTVGWEVGGNCTLSSTTSQAQSGTRSLQLTSSGAGGMWANTTTGTGGVPVAAGDAVKASGWLRSATRSVTGKVCVLFWDAAGTYLGQTDSTGTATSTSAWTQVSVATVAPVGAASASAQVLYDSPIAGSEVHYADTVSLQGTAVTDGLPVRVRMSWGGVAYDRFYGELADVQVDLGLTPDATATFTCTDGMEKLGRAYLPETLSPVRDGDTTGERVTWLASEAAWPSSLLSVETGYTTLGRSTLGETAIALMAKAESTEFGLLFVSGGGVLTFYDRHHPTTATRSTVNQATFGDPVGAIGIQQLQLSRSRDRTFNRVAITRDPLPDDPIAGGGLEEPPGDEPVEQVADDPVTQGIKGVLAFPAQVGELSRNDSDALALAQYLVQRFKGVANRIREVQVNVLRGGWATLLPLEPLDLVTVTRDYGPNTVSVQLHIQGVGPEEIQANPPAWNLTLSTSNPPAASSLWRVGTSQVGVDRLGW